MSSIINKSGRLYVNSNKTVFVASNPGCPKLILSRSRAVLKDDFGGKLLVMNKYLIKKL